MARQKRKLTQEALRTEGAIFAVTKVEMKPGKQLVRLAELIDQHAGIPALKDTIDRLSGKIDALETENKRLRKELKAHAVAA